MPTSTRAPDSLYILPMGTLVYLTNDPLSVKLGITDAHIDASIRGTFGCKHRLYFTEDELVRKTASIAVFELNSEDWCIAKYVVVGKNDVRLVCTSFSFKDYENTKKGWQYPDHGL